MSNNFIPGLLQAPNCRIRRVRELPIRGQTLVKKDQQVKPDSIVASAELPGDVQILRIAESMGIEASDVASGIKVKVGQQLSNGQIICEHSGLFGLFRSQFKAPCEGTVDFISEALGHIGIRLPSQVLTINAYSGGKITEVIEDLSVEVETHATIIQGIFGVGGERLGTIELLEVKPDQILCKQDIPADIKGKILVGGTLPNIEVLEMLAEQGAVGLVVGGIDDIALRKFLGFDIGLAVTGNENISFSLMVTEGFGKLAISERVMSLFKNHQGSFACMNGTTQIRAGAIRPEIIIPTPGTAVASDSGISKGLELGARVRLIRVPYFGLLGEVVELPPKPEKLEAGSFARVLRVRLGGGEVVTVPRANAEIIL